MALEEYARKRHFDKTPEPAPSIAAPAVRSRYFIQRHDARRLHYDFRLEIGGTLKSWAVPHGPTLDPAEKRLAVMVEDHPLDYGNFEGNIPAGNYGAGSVMLWDRGHFELLGDKTPDEQLERGDFKFRLDGEKLQGEFAIVRMKNRGKGNEWLLLKKKDTAAQPGWDGEKFAFSVLTGRTQEEIAKDMPSKIKKKAAKKKPKRAPLPEAVSAELPAQVAAMEPTPAAKPPRGVGWVHEIDWNGARAFARVEGGSVRLTAASGTPLDELFPELTVIPHFLEAETAVLDGQIAVLDEAGRPDGAELRTRLASADPNSISHMLRKRPATYFAFDLLYADGYDLRAADLASRKKLLASLVRPGAALRYSDHLEIDGAEILEAVRGKGLPGILAKKAASAYEGKRTRDWLRIPSGKADPEPLPPEAGTPVFPADKTDLFVFVNGRRLHFTNLNKVYYPGEGYTKGDVLRFYNSVADLLLPYLKDRPLSLRRYPNGIADESFFQKNAEPLASWVRSVPVEEHGKKKLYAVADDRATLLYLVNLGCIDHNPWMSRAGSLSNPDFVLIDLDPYECGYDRIVEAAQLVRAKLKLIGLEGYPKTTGGDGMHLYIPVEPVYTYEHTRTFAEVIARMLAAERPDLFTTPRAVSQREKGKVYFDYLQNGEGKTISAPYVLRAYPGAPVATPLDWSEVKAGLEPSQFHIGNALHRFEQKGDLFAAVLKKPQRLDKAMQKLDKLLRG